ncbi:MAG: hypothetical protein Q9N32_00235 [Gammaproteobacteria bacterium]|nr:hypothetical protein [Gammaproteobacteria bacterium]
MIKWVFISLLLAISNHVFAVNELAEQGQFEFVESGVNVNVTLRKHGYTLGDKVKMHIEFLLGEAYSFDPKSIPLKGPVTSWLDLRDITLQQEKVDDGKSVIKIDFLWQLFGTVTEAQIIQIPQIILRTLPVEVVGNEQQQTLVIKVPEQGLYLSPVLPEQLSDEEVPRPILPPPSFDTTTPLRFGIISLVLAVLLAIYWLYLNDKISWLPRHPGAMTVLARQLRKQGVVKQPALTMTDLRIIHRALASCAGQSLYPNTLNTLFENAPYLKDEKETISQFFNETWRLFHQKNVVENTISVAETLAWIRRVAMAERMFR